MKSLLRWVSRLVVLLLVIVVVLVAYVYAASARLLARTYPTDNLPHVTVRTDPGALARGKYLVERGACAECHDKDFGGKVLEDSVAMGHLSSANLTSGTGGLGAVYSDADFVRSIVHGVKRDGHSVVYMPSSDYQFTEEDLGSILGYLRSLPAVDRVPAPASVGPMARALGLFTDFPLTPAAHIDHATVHLAPTPGSDLAGAGAYVVSSAGCKGCHGPDLRGGGGPPPGAGNITPVGIGDWTEQQFLTALREHKRPNGTIIEEVMPRVYGQMSDADLRSVFAYLKTVPPAGEKSANQKKAN
jgi:mono/diheme cytochrome c family protein